MIYAVSQIFSLLLTTDSNMYPKYMFLDNSIVCSKPLESRAQVLRCLTTVFIYITAYLLHLPFIVIFLIFSTHSLCTRKFLSPGKTWFVFYLTYSAMFQALSLVFISNHFSLVNMIAMTPANVRATPLANLMAMPSANLRAMTK